MVNVGINGPNWISCSSAHYCSRKKDICMVVILKIFSLGPINWFNFKIIRKSTTLAYTPCSTALFVSHIIFCLCKSFPFMMKLACWCLALLTDGLSTCSFTNPCLCQYSVHSLMFFKRGLSFWFKWIWNFSTFICMAMSVFKVTVVFISIYLFLPIDFCNFQKS